MKSSASQPLGQSAFKERRAGNRSPGTLHRAFAHQAALLPKDGAQFGKSRPGPDFLLIQAMFGRRQATHEDLFTAAAALQRGTAREEPTSRLRWGICFQLGVCVCASRNRAQ